MSTMLTDVRAELTKQLRRPTHWLLLGVAVVLTLTFGYLVPYLGLEGGSDTVGPQRGLASMLPAQFVGSAVAGTPMFLGALAVIFGVLVVGGEYGYETWKTVLAQGTSRLRALAAKLAVTALGTLGLMLVLFAAAAGSSALVASLQGQPLDWPSVSDVLTGLGTGWLITAMWAMLGVFLAVALRGVALPVGLGLVWLLAVQNLLTAIAAPLLGWVAELQKVLPGPNAGSLVAAVGAPQGTPGVSALVGSGHAIAALAGYIFVFVGVSTWLFRRRDVV